MAGPRCGRLKFLSTFSAIDSRKDRLYNAAEELQKPLIYLFSGSRKTNFTPPSFGFEKLSSNVGAEELFDDLAASVGFVQVPAGLSAERKAPSTS